MLGKIVFLIRAYEENLPEKINRIPCHRIRSRLEFASDYREFHGVKKVPISQSAIEIQMWFCFEWHEIDLNFSETFDKYKMNVCLR